MSKKKLPPGELKIKITISIDPKLFNIINKLYHNKSKYIEKIIYEDLNGCNKPQNTL